MRDLFKNVDNMINTLSHLNLSKLKEKHAKKHKIRLSKTHT
jgi:hypothetical protein